MVKLRQRVKDDVIRAYFQKYAWDAPINFIGHSAPASVFLQFGQQDKPITEKMARRYHELFAEPKRVSFYDAGHKLDAAARRARASWLRARFSLKPIDMDALGRIPQLK